MYFIYYVPVVRLFSSSNIQLDKNQTQLRYRILVPPFTPNPAITSFRAKEFLVSKVTNQLILLYKQSINTIAKMKVVDKKQV